MPKRVSSVEKSESETKEKSTSKTKKASAAETKSKGTHSSKVDELFAVAKKRGYISQEEILKSFPKPEDHIADLDHLYDQLLKKRNRYF